MTRISTFCVVSSTLAVLALSANGALAEPPDPCKTGCKTGKGSHASVVKPVTTPLYQSGGHAHSLRGVGVKHLPK
jgi:hypothetical protein